MAGKDTPQIRVVRIITRLNVGGSGMHAILIQHHGTGRFPSLLVAGREESTEGNLLEMAAERGIEPVLIDEMLRPIHPGRDLLALWKIIRLLRRLRPQVVETHTAKAGILGRVAAWITGVPVIIHVFHGHVFYGYFSNTVSKVILMVERFLARLSTRIVMVSEQGRDELIKFRVAPAEKVEYIPLGLELDAFAASGQYRGRLRSELGLGPDDLTVGIIGRLTPIKAHKDFFKAAKMVSELIPKVYFLVVGDGELRGEVEEEAEQLDLKDKILFLGWRTDLDRIYADLDLVVLSSHNEGMPMTVIEAMVAGAPVVATRVGGVPTLVADGIDGILIEPGDVEAMAKGMLHLLTDNARRKEMVLKGKRKMLETYHVSNVVETYESLYEHLLEEKKPK